MLQRNALPSVRVSFVVLKQQMVADVSILHNVVEIARVAIQRRQGMNRGRFRSLYAVTCILRRGSSNQRSFSGGLPIYRDSNQQQKITSPNNAFAMGNSGPTKLAIMPPIFRPQKCQITTISRLIGAGSSSYIIIWVPGGLPHILILRNLLPK